MKRFHVHLRVNNLNQSIRFYQALFNTQPSVVKGDYAKWMLDDPQLNFAISTGEGEAGIRHLGLQTDSSDELKAVYQNLQNADGTKENIENVQPETPQEVTSNTEDNDDVLNEIEDSNAEDAEDEGNVDRHNIEDKDYESLNLEQLVIELERLVKNEKVQAIKNNRFWFKGCCYYY